MLLLGLLGLILVEGSVAAALHFAASEARLVADRRAALDADWALATATSVVRLAADSTIAALAPGTRATPTPPSLPGWVVRAEVERPGAVGLVVLRLHVVSVDTNSAVQVERRGTLLLVTESADTAIVLDNRPGW
jgi:hypothetical protein